MKESSNNILEHLLKNHSFDELSQEDKSFVLSNISEKEYRAYQSIISSTSALNAPPVPPSIKESLKQDFRNIQSSNTSSFQKFLGFQLPLWLVMGVACLVAGLYWFTSDADATAKPEIKIVHQEQEPQIIYRTDTIYKEIKSTPIVITKEVEKIIYVDREVEASANDATNIDRQFASNPDQDAFNTETSFFSNVDINDLSNQKQQGRSVSQDAALMNLIDDVESKTTMK